jgi:hypothetical protein
MSSRRSHWRSRGYPWRPGGTGAPEGWLGPITGVRRPLNLNNFNNLEAHWFDVEGASWSTLWSTLGPPGFQVTLEGPGGGDWCLTRAIGLTQISQECPGSLEAPFTDPCGPPYRTVVGGPVVGGGPRGHLKALQGLHRPPGNGLPRDHEAHTGHTDGEDTRVPQVPPCPWWRKLVSPGGQGRQLWASIIY